MTSVLEIRHEKIYYGDFLAVDDVNVTIPKQSITALIGPSGCGKSTFLRTLNRMHEAIPGARVEGEVVLEGQNIYDKSVDPVQVRRRVGMVFQRPNPFPTMSIAEKVLAGITLNSRKMKRDDAEELVEESLRGANLWNEVKDRLDEPGSGLSSGQQQRLCIARTIEDLMNELKDEYTIVIVTHNMQQAARVSQKTGFFNLEATGKPGKLIEFDDTETAFSHPSEQATEDYISGRFG